MKSINKIVSVLFSAYFLSGCISSKTAADLTAGLNLAGCILDHSQDPVSLIAQECSGASIELITTVLSKHKAAMAREASKKAASACDGGNCSNQ